MSAAALQYAKDLAQSEGRGGLTSSQCLVLRALALMHEPAVQCAFAPMARIASEAMMGERNARRVVGDLEVKGLVRRIYATRDHDGSQTTNEYELPGLAGWMAAQEADLAAGVGTGKGAVQSMGRGTAGASKRRRQVPTASDAGAGAAVAEVTAEDRSRVFKRARTRMAVQRPLALDGVDKGAFCPGGGGQQLSAPPGQQLSAREVVFEVVFDDSPNPSLAPVAAKVENNSKSLPGDTKTGTATTATTAAATTVPEPGCAPAAEAGAERWAGRTAGRAAGHRTPNGFDHDPGSPGWLLEAEGARVLRACGIPAESSTRRLREAVEGALRLRCDAARAGDRPCSVGEAGDLAVEHWENYRDAAGRNLLRYTVGVRKFFDLGIWMTPELWPFDRDVLQARSR